MRGRGGRRRFVLGGAALGAAALGAIARGRVLGGARGAAGLGGAALGAAALRGAALGGAALGGCGLRPVYGGADPEGRLTVAAGETHSARAELLAEALAGARAELGRAGVLGGGGGWPRLVIELLRVDELGAGPLVTGGRPLARGVSVGVTGRGRVVLRAGESAAVDSGDVRRVATVASGATPLDDAALVARAGRAAARELGRALARHALGEPEPGLEPM